MIKNREIEEVVMPNGFKVKGDFTDIAHIKLKAHFEKSVHDYSGWPGRRSYCVVDSYYGMMDNEKHHKREKWEIGTNRPPRRGG
jgi:hypothetical protein